MKDLSPKWNDVDLMSEEFAHLRARVTFGTDPRGRDLRHGWRASVLRQKDRTAPYTGKPFYTLEHDRECGHCHRMQSSAMRCAQELLEAVETVERMKADRRKAKEVAAS